MGVVGDVVLFVWHVGLASLHRLPRLRDALVSLYSVLELSWRPVVTVVAPIGMVLTLSFDSLLGMLGWRFIASSGIVPGIVREAGPMFAGLILATTGGASFCADISARKVRGELDALETMAVDPRTHLYLPRIVAMTIAGPIVAISGTLAGVIGGWALIVLLRQGSSGLFLNGFDLILDLADVAVLLAKSVTYGFLIGVMTMFIGSRAKSGPSGVARAVRHSIITNYALVALTGFMINQAFYSI